MSDHDTVVAELFARQPNRMVPDLDRITTLAGLLGRPDQAFPSVHVTGTNGKGSVVRMVSCLFGALGLSAGSYTSPHLQDVRERIRVATAPIDPEEFAAGLDYLAPFVAETDVRHAEPLTFFEILTALSFTHFADKPVDVAVYEVGMGGRWDATNLVRGEVAVLNEVALDHAELGGTLAEVAAEKAGIVKPGAVVVCAEQAPEALRVIEAAVREREAQLVLAGSEFAVAERRLAVGGQVLTLRGLTGEVDEIFLPLHGAHQADNAALALAAVEGFFGFSGGIDPDVVREGFAAVRVPGRLELVRRHGAAPVLLDGAHNPAGARALAAALKAEFAYRNRVFVLGVLDDKDVEGIVAELLAVADHLVITEPPSERAASPQRIERAVRAAGRSVEIAPDVPTALELASGLAAEEDGVVVAGSLYVVGAARDALGLEPE